MKNTFTIVLWMLSIGFASAQTGTWVNIPDQNFAKAIKQILPSAVNEAWQLDTSSNEVKTLRSLYVRDKNISSIEGIQYFRALNELDANNNNIEYGPSQWPSTLENLYFESNNLRNFPILPAGLKVLDLANNYITSVPSVLPAGLIFLRITNNAVTTLPDLRPYPLTAISIGGTKIIQLKNLPNTIEQIEAQASQIRTIDKLPDNLLFLYAQNNHIEYIGGGFPSNVIHVDLESNDLAHVPYNASPSLEYLNLDNNRLEDFLITNNEGLEYVSVNNNLIGYLPELPPNATNFYINNNLLTALPDEVSYGLKFFEASYNFIKYVPDAYYGRAYTSFIASYNCIQNHKTVEFWQKFGYVDTPNRNDCDVITKVANVSKLDVTAEIYPNPVHDAFMITTPNFQAEQVTVINDQGRELYNVANYVSGMSISLKDLPQGMYFAVFKVENKTIIKKVIKE